MIPLALVPPNLAFRPKGVSNGTVIVKSAGAQLPYIIRICEKGGVLLILLSRLCGRLGKE